MIGCFEQESLFVFDGLFGRGLEVEEGWKRNGRGRRIEGENWKWSGSGMKMEVYLKDSTLFEHDGLFWLW